MFYRILAFFVHLHAIECQVRQLFEHPKLSHSPYMAYPIIGFINWSVFSPWVNPPFSFPHRLGLGVGFVDLADASGVLKNHGSPRGFPWTMGFVGGSLGDLWGSGFFSDPFKKWGIARTRWCLLASGWPRGSRYCTSFLGCLSWDWSKALEYLELSTIKSIVVCKFFHMLIC